MKSTITYLQTMKTFSAVTIGAALALPLSSQTPAAQTASDAPMQKPNIIVILVDDFGWGSIGCFGAPAELKTPNIDRLASEGRRFTDVYNTSSVCSPTRYALMTGRYYWRTRVKHGGVLAADSPLHIETNRLTLGSLCQGQGYRTAAIGKWHLGIENPPGANWNMPLTPGAREVGFDYFFGLGANPWNGPHTFIENDSLLGRIPGESVRVIGGNYGPDTYTEGIEENWDTRYIMETITNKATGWIEENSSEPFFLYFATNATHTPIDPHPRFTGSPYGILGDFIEETDWSVGQILATLDSLNLADNTLVIFASDDGYARGEYATEAIQAGLPLNGPLRGSKHTDWEGGFRTPVIARWPGTVPAGTVSDQIFCLSDMLATFARILDVPLPEDNAEDSFDVWRFFTEEEPGQGEPLPFVIMQNFGSPNAIGNYAIRMGDFKFIEPWDESRGGGDLYQNPRLYNLRNDIGETNNIFAANAELAEQMQRVLSEARDRGYTRPGAGK